MGINEKAWHVGFKWTIGNEDVPTGAICVDNTSKQLHICDIADSNKDWNVAVLDDPALYIHCYDTNAATDYIKIWHDDTDANIRAYNATAINFGIGASDYLEMTTSALAPTTTNTTTLGTSSLTFGDLYLGSGAVIDWNSDITLTHTADSKLALVATWDSATALGRPFLVQLNVDNVRLGSYANAFKAYVVCDESGSSQGVLSVGNFEISMPSTGGGEGVYTCTEHEMVCPSGYNSSGCIASFMYFNSGGDGEAEFDTTGFFFHIDTGITAGASKVLSANSQTLKVGLGANAGTARYLVMSTLENGLTMTGITAGTTTPVLTIGSAASPTVLEASGDYGAQICNNYTLATGGYTYGTFINTVYTPTTSSGVGNVINLMGQVDIPNGKTMNEASAGGQRIAGVTGYAANNGTLNGAGVVFSGVEGIVGATAGAWTNAQYISCFTAISQIDESPTTSYYCGYLVGEFGGFEYDYGFCALEAHNIGFASINQKADSTVQAAFYVNATSCLAVQNVIEVVDGASVGSFLKVDATGGFAADDGQSHTTAAGELTILVGGNARYILTYKT